MAAQGFAAIQPGQRSVQQRRAAYLAPVVGRRIPLHRSPDRVSVVGRDVVALTVDVKKYVHLFRQGVLCRVHVRMAEARVVRVWVLPVEDRRVMVAHPARLVRSHLHVLGCARALSPGPEPSRVEGGLSAWEVRGVLPSEAQERGSLKGLFVVKWIEKVSKGEGLGRNEKSLRDSLAKRRKERKKRERMKKEGDPLQKKKKKERERETNPSVATVHTGSLALRDGCSSDHLGSKERRGGGGGGV